MKRRSNINDYYGRHIYMVTMAVEGRRPLLGSLRGSPTVADGQEGAPCVVPTPLRQEVIRCWELIPRFHHEVRLLASRDKYNTPRDLTNFRSALRKFRQFINIEMSVQESEKHCSGMLERVGDNMANLWLNTDYSEGVTYRISKVSPI